MVQHHDIFWLLEIVTLSLSLSFFRWWLCITFLLWLWYQRVQVVVVCDALCVFMFTFFVFFVDGTRWQLQSAVMNTSCWILCMLPFVLLLYFGRGLSVHSFVFCRRVYLMQREEGKSKCGQNKKRWSALRGFTNGLKTGKSNDIARLFAIFLCCCLECWYPFSLAIHPPPFSPFILSLTLLPLYLFLSVSVLPILMGHVVCSRFVSWVSCGFYCVETYRLNPLPTRNLLWFWLFGLVNNSIVC